MGLRTASPQGDLCWPSWALQSSPWYGLAHSASAYTALSLWPPALPCLYSGDPPQLTELDAFPWDSVPDSRGPS